MIVKMARSPPAGAQLGLDVVPASPHRWSCGPPSTGPGPDPGDPAAVRVGVDEVMLWKGRPVLPRATTF